MSANNGSLIERGRSMVRNPLKTKICREATALLISALAIQAWALSDGYILCGAWGNNYTYLFDKDGKVIHTWNHKSLPDSKNGYSCYLLENGNLLRSGQAPSSIRVSANAQPLQGTINEIDHAGAVVWTYTHADEEKMMHHDFKPMPNGHIIGVSFLNVTKADAIAAGIDSSIFSNSGSGIGGTRTIEAEEIFELVPDRTGGGDHQIVWQWRILDHVIPEAQAGEHPELFNGKTGPLFVGQWVHLNGIDYDAKRDLVLFSSRVHSEVFVIDHSTTTAEAAGHTGGTHGKGGDLLYRWGRPSNYLVEYKLDTVYTAADTTTDWMGREVITPADTTVAILKQRHANDVVNCLHSPTWIPEGYRGAGNILFFHNNVDAGMSRLGASQVIEVTPSFSEPGKFLLAPGVPSGPAAAAWTYVPADDMFSKSMSTALRMKNGNTLIHEAYPGDNRSGKNSTVREVDPSGKVVWGPFTLESPVDSSADTGSQDPGIPWGGGLVGTAGFNPAKIMYYPSDYIGIAKLFEKLGITVKTAGARGANRSRKVEMARLQGKIDLTGVKDARVTFFSVQGRLIASFNPGTDRFSIPVRMLPSGTVLVKIVAPECSKTTMISLVR